ncbi:MAG TPA: hypothetical protein VFD72_00675 [Sphingobacteriaceae bacterium]|nr:hypothetical protein [Sphingobacteriaceae bacterium]
MQITIKDVVNATIRPAAKSNLLEVEIDGIEPEDILLLLDIRSAIAYFGEIELLDVIGEETLRSYLKQL